MKRSILVSLILSFLILASTYAFATQDDEKLEHSIIKPMPGAQLVDRPSYHSNHHTLKLRVEEGRKRTTKEVSGEYWHLKYIMKDGSGNCRSIWSYVLKRVTRKRNDRRPRHLFKKYYEGAALDQESLSNHIRKDI